MASPTSSISISSASELASDDTPVDQGRLPFASHVDIKDERQNYVKGNAFSLNYVKGKYDNDDNGENCPAGDGNCPVYDASMEHIAFPGVSYLFGKECKE